MPLRPTRSLIAPLEYDLVESLPFAVWLICGSAIIVVLVNLRALGIQAKCLNGRGGETLDRVRNRRSGILVVLKFGRNKHIESCLKAEHAGTCRHESMGYGVGKAAVVNKSRHASL